MLERRRYLWGAVAAAVGAAFVWILFGRAMDDRDTKTVRLAGQALQIPVGNLAEEIPLWLRLVPGLRDDSNAVNLQFTAAELWTIPGYDRQRTRVTFATLTVMGPAEQTQVETHWGATAAEMWEGRGSYHDRVLDPIPGTRLVRVRRPFDRGGAWAVLHAPVEGGVPQAADLADSLLGFCHRRAFGKVEENACNVDLRFDDVTLNLHISESSLAAVNEMRSYFAARVRSWRRP